MDPSNEDYESVARRLDGEDAALSARQQALAGQLADDEAVVGRALDAPMPPGVLHRVAARALSARRRRARRVRPTAVAAGVAVALTAGLWWLGGWRAEPVPEVSTERLVEEFVKMPSADLQAAIDTMADELAITTLNVLTDAPEIDLAIAGLEEELGRGLLEEDFGTESSDEAWWENL